MRRCLLVDFDGTLTNRDTTRALIQNLLRLRPWRFIFIIYGYFRLYISTENHHIQFWKNWCVGKLIKGLSKEDINQPFEDYASQVTSWIRKDILNYLCERHAAGDRVLIVTASFELAVAHLLQRHGFVVLGCLFTHNGLVFGDETYKPECFGSGKVRRVMDWLEISGENIIFSEAWSDTLSDIPMMRLAKKQVWVCQIEKNEHFADAFPNAFFWNY